MISTLGPRNRGNYLDKCSTVNVKANLFKVDFKEDTKAFIYAVKTQPEIGHDNNKKLRTILIQSRKIIERLIGTFAVSGRTVFGTKVQQCGKGGELTFKIDYEETKYHFFLKLVKEISLGDIYSDDKRKTGIVYSFLNNILKNFFHQVNYTEIGKSGKYFDAKNCKRLDSAKVIIFKGYSSNFSLLEGGLFLKIDPAVKIVRDESVLEVINKVYASNKGCQKLEKRNLVEKQLVGKQVMANYGKNAYYIIESILFQTSLDGYTFSNGKKDIKLTEYYKDQYGIELTSTRQPLVKAALDKRDKTDKEIILIPELLLMAGLPDNFDERKRRQISEHTIVPPSSKLSELSAIFHSFNSDGDDFNPDIVKQKLGIKISTTPSTISAKQLRLPELQLGKRDKVDEIKATNFQLFNKQLYYPEVPLKISVICTNELDLSETKNILSSTCKNLGLRYQLVPYPVRFNDVRSALKNIEQIIEKESDKKDGSNMFWFIIPNNFKTNYSALKKIVLKKEIQKSSQITLTSTMQKKGFQSVLTKILLQMASKVGNKLWVPKVSRPLVSSSGVLMIGIENYGIQNDKNMSVLSFCSNSDREYSEFFSNFIVHKKSDTKTHMNQIVFECLTEYYRYNGNAPSDIILMKNGSSKYDNSVLIQNEVNEVKDVIKAIQKKERINLIYVLLDKDTNQKFFNDKGRDVANPSSGLLVNSQAVGKGFEFYLIAQQCNKGTVKPTFYKVMYSDSSLEEGLVQELIFSQCFNYMNWTGSIKVPSVMQYAKKLSMFAGQYLGEKCVGENMSRNLYYI